MTNPLFQRSTRQLHFEHLLFVSCSFLSLQFFFLSSISFKLILFFGFFLSLVPAVSLGITPTPAQRRVELETSAAGFEQ